MPGRQRTKTRYAPTSVASPSNAPENAYGAAFCSLPGADARLLKTFATCAGPRAEVYECEDDGGMRVVASFEASGNEEFYVCAWCAIDARDSARSGSGRATSGTRRTPCLALAGTGSVVRVVDCVTGRTHVDLVGHGGTVNTIATHPTEPTVIATGSKDLSVRLWHANTGVTMAIFAGGLGHRNDVLSVDIHRTLDSEMRMKILSGAMDNCVKVWATPSFERSFRDAATWDKPLAEFKTIVVDAPMFSSNRVHEDYVDCVAWCGDAALSRSVDGVTKMWVPDEPVGVLHAQGEQYRLVGEFPQEDAILWWLKFSLSASRNVLASGNMKGAVSVWRLDEPDVLDRGPSKLAPFPARKSSTHQKSLNSAFNLEGNPPVVRQCAVSADGSIIVAACDNGIICRWDECRDDESGDESGDESDDDDDESDRTNANDDRGVHTHE